MVTQPMVIKRTGLAGVFHKGGVARRMLGLLQYCGLCGESYHASAACGGVTFLGTTQDVCLAAGKGAKGVVAVLCLRNHNAQQSLSVVCADSCARYVAVLREDDVLVAPLHMPLYFGSTAGGGNEHVGAYFVAAFCPCADADSVHDGFAVVVASERARGVKNEILYSLNEPAE